MSLVCLSRLALTTGMGYGARTHEEVVGIWVGAADLEELHQVVELAMDISAHGDGAFLQGTGARLALVDFCFLLPLRCARRRRAGRAAGRAGTYHWLYVRLLLQDFPSLSVSQSVKRGTGFS